MAQETEQSLQIQRLTGLQPKHFDDFIRAAQVVFDPSSGVAGRFSHVEWSAFGISPAVLENLQAIGSRYRAPSYVPIALIWSQLTPETRSWLIENRNELWRVEELVPSLDD